MRVSKYTHIMSQISFDGKHKLMKSKENPQKPKQFPPSFLESSSHSPPFRFLEKLRLLRTWLADEAQVSVVLSMLSKSVGLKCFENSLAFWGFDWGFWMFLFFAGSFMFFFCVFFFFLAQELFDAFSETASSHALVFLGEAFAFLRTFRFLGFKPLSSKASIIIRLLPGQEAWVDSTRTIFKSRENHID